MNRIRTVALASLSFLLVQAAAAEPIPIAAVRRSQPVSFQEEILPILRKNCLACHHAGQSNGALVLESPAAMFEGGDSGAAVIAGESAASLLLSLAAHEDDPAMPPPGNKVAAQALTPQQLGLLKLWIDQGAKDDSRSALLSPKDWRPLPPGKHPLFALALSPDGQFAACGRANQIYIYHVPTGRLVTRLNDPELQAASGDGRPGIAHLDAVQSLAFSKQGDLLASGGFRNVKIWRHPRDVQTAALTSAAAVLSVAVSPDRELIAVGGADHQVRLWKTPGAETAVTPPIVLSGHTGEVRSLCFSADGTQLYSAAADRTVCVWDASSGSLAGRIETAAELNAVTPLSFPGPIVDGQSSAPVERLAVGGADHLVRVWNAPASLPRPLAVAPPQTNRLAVSSDGGVMALAGAGGQVRLINSETDELIRELVVAGSPIRDLALLVRPDQSAAESTPVDAPTADNAPADQAPRVQLAVAREDGAVTVFDAELGEPVVSLLGAQAAVESIDFSPDGRQLVAGAADGGVTIWNLHVPPPRPMETIEAPAAVTVVSPDGQRSASAGTAEGTPPRSSCGIWIPASLLKHCWGIRPRS